MQWIAFVMDPPQATVAVVVTVVVTAIVIVVVTVAQQLSQLRRNLAIFFVISSLRTTASFLPKKHCFLHLNLNLNS